MKKCPFCAEEIQDAAVVCKHCGRSLGRGQVSQIGALLAAFACILFVWSVFVFDTSVAVGGGARVNNLGLMQERQIAITVSIVLGVLAALAFWKLPREAGNLRRRRLGWIVVGVLVAAVVAVPVIGNLPSSADNSLENFNSLYEGMTYAEVERLVGDAWVRTTDSGTEPKTYSWESVDRRFYVTFRNDKLWSKSQAGIMKER